jgi:hypothetical protein
MTDYKISKHTYVIRPCMVYDGCSVRVCKPEEAQFWTVYETVAEEDGFTYEYAIEDFDTKKDAEKHLRKLLCNRS